MSRRKTGAPPIQAPTTDEALVVKSVKNGDGKRAAHTGKPRKIPKIAMASRVASLGLGNASAIQGTGGNFYSPELSTDFLELPQSLFEQWNYYRFFYRTEPFVGQAVDIHVELPLSKIRIGIPKGAKREIAMAATRFCDKWSKRIDLLGRLYSIVRDLHLIGEVFVWCEDSNPEMPIDIREYAIKELTDDGKVVESWVPREDADDRAVAWLKKNYKGWTSIRVLPPEQVRMESFNFTDQKIIELLPSSSDKAVVERARAGDAGAARVVASMPEEVIKAVVEGQNIPLNTDPDAGSFCYYLANKKSDYEPRGHSILERCMRALVFRDKLRQAQTSIASRHMTPIRLVWAPDMDLADVEALREQIDMALMDPDYSIITNFQVTWEEMGADQRLLDLSGEYDLTDRQLYAGLGVTEGLLSGESAYSGDRINLEVINTRYMLLRDQIQNFVETQIFKPMCARMGFVDVDEDGEEFVVTPTLSFTRLALRDNRDTFDILYNLYTKGSVDIETILDLLNLDPVTVREKLEKDLFTVNDPTFNEVLRNIYSGAGSELVQKSDAVQKIADSIRLKFTPPPEEGGDGRF